MPAEPRRPATYRVDAQQLLRWQRERRLMEQTERDDRTLRRRRVILWLVVAFLLVDLVVAVGVILTTSTPRHDRTIPVHSSSSASPVSMR